MENLVIPRPVNEKALRRWIDEQYEGTAACFTWTIEQCLEYVGKHHVRGVEAFRPTDYTSFEAYTKATPRGRASVDAVFHAVRNVTGPDYGMEVDADGSLGCAFTWHDGAKYRVKMTPGGVLARLFRLEITGAWEWDEDKGREVPEIGWRTVRAFSKDRAGKALATPGALAGVPATASWNEASKR